MKKLLTTLTIVLGFTLGVCAQQVVNSQNLGNAQNLGNTQQVVNTQNVGNVQGTTNPQYVANGGLFEHGAVAPEGIFGVEELRGVMDGLPGLPDHNQGSNQNAGVPLGSGLLLLAGLGAAYAVAKKREE